MYLNIALGQKNEELTFLITENREQTEREGTNDRLTNKKIIH